MSRPLRIEFPGAWYHVMNRGLGRKGIFLSDDDRRAFLELLGEISEIFRVEVYAYSLMGNHYHLLIHTPQGGLGRALRHLNGIYTQRFNRRWKTDGPLFRGRYKAQLVETDEYLEELVRYIHLNPVKSGLCRYPKDHPWTSHIAYLRPRLRPSWLMTQEVLDRFGSAETEATRALNTYVLAGVSEEFEQTVEAGKTVLGSRGFRDWVRENLLNHKRKERELPLRDRVPRVPVTPKQVLEFVAHAYGVRTIDLRKGERGKENQPRSMAIYLLRRLVGLPHREIATWMKCPTEYTVATLQKRFKGKLLKERKVRELAQHLSHSVLSHVKT